MWDKANKALIKEAQEYAESAYAGGFGDFPAEDEQHTDDDNENDEEDPLAGDGFYHEETSKSNWADELEKEQKKLEENQKLGKNIVEVDIEVGNNSASLVACYLSLLILKTQSTTNATLSDLHHASPSIVR